MRKAVVVSAARTAIGKYKGQWTPLSEAQLGAEAYKAAITRAGISPAEVDDVIVGNVAGVRGNIARLIGFLAGCPEEVPAFNVDRQCGSGSQAIAIAAMNVMCGMGDIYVAGGVEMMTRTPYQMEKPADAFPNNPPKFVSRIYAPLDMYENLVMPQTADKLAAMKGVTREECDEFALLSHQRAAKAITEGVYKDEIVPVEVKTKAGSVTVDTDECVRYNASLETMAKLKPLFTGGVTTAGNSCPRSDGAGAVVIMSEEMAKARGLDILAYVSSFCAAGCDPTIMGYGPVPAVSKLLKMTGLTIRDIDMMELNEAFAGQAVPCVRDLGIDIAKVNPNGGAIALGHPLGGTGGVLATKLLYEMRRKDYQRGIVTMCTGGGQGYAVLYERK